MNRWTLVFATLLVLIAVGQTNASVVALHDWTAPQVFTSSEWTRPVSDPQPATPPGKALTDEPACEEDLALGHGFGLADIAAICQRELAAFVTPGGEDLCRFLDVGSASIESFQLIRPEALGDVPENLLLIGCRHRRRAPEPATLALWSLLGLSFAGAGWWRRRSRSDDWEGGSRPAVRPFPVARPKHAKKAWPEDAEVAIKRLIDRHGVV